MPVSMLDAVAHCYNHKGLRRDWSSWFLGYKFKTCFRAQICLQLVMTSCSRPVLLQQSVKFPPIIARRHSVHVQSHSTYHRINYQFSYRIHNGFMGHHYHITRKVGKGLVFVAVDMLSNSDSGYVHHLLLPALLMLSRLDTLTFLAVTVLVVPGFRMIKASPILGFFFAGVVLNQLGLIRNITDVKVLSEWGIFFWQVQLCSHWLSLKTMLFEMGLELSLVRLSALANFAFGLGLTQEVLLSILAFTAFELPPNGAIGTRILEFLFHSRNDLLLAERGKLPTRFGSATLGILLLQDIAVVPLLVILPVLESQNLVEESVWPMLAKESLKAILGLGLPSIGGKYLLRRVFEVVAEAKSSEAFVALCLLTVAGTLLITQKLGFSDTLGPFLAGSILAETNFHSQIEADIRPFRGLLLGLFFCGNRYFY